MMCGNIDFPVKIDYMHLNCCFRGLETGEPDVGDE